MVMGTILYLISTCVAPQEHNADVNSCKECVIQEELVTDSVLVKPDMVCKKKKK